jgi:hypothetical protein
VSTLDGINTDSATPSDPALRLGYAVEGGQSVKTSEIIVGTTIYDSASRTFSIGTGAAYVFKQFSAATWSQQVRLQPSDLTDGTNDKFGASVAIDEFDPTRIMVGAPLASTSSTGAVYFYQSSPTAKYWTQGQKLMPNNPTANARFGDEVELFGRFAAITEPENCQVYIFEQERPKPKAKPKVSCGEESSPVAAPTPSPVTSTWQVLNQHETLRWSQQQVLSFNDTFNCDVGGRTRTYSPISSYPSADPTFFDGDVLNDDPLYGDTTGNGYGGYLSISMFEDTLAIGVPGYEDVRVRNDYRDENTNPTHCQFSCTGLGPFSKQPFPDPDTVDCCPLYETFTCTAAGTFSGGSLHLGHCENYPYAPGDNGRVYIYDMETFKGDCDRKNYFPTVLSFDELVNLRDKDHGSDKDDDDCHDHDHYVHKPKPKPQCEVSRWSQQVYLTSPSPADQEDLRNSDCQNFGYKVDVYKDVVTVNEINTLSFNILDATHETFADPITPTLVDEYHCMDSLYYPRYDKNGVASDPLVKNGYVYAYEKTSSNTWSPIGGTAPGYDINVNPAATGIEATNTQVVGTDIFTMESESLSYTLDMQSTDNTWQCMVVTLMDQFGDGWGGAELQITDSDGRKQTFAPYCDTPGASVPFVYTFR